MVSASYNKKPIFNTKTTTVIAEELISNIVPPLKVTDKGFRALNWMEVFKVSHLPIVKDKNYLAIISDKEIYDYDLVDSTFEHHSLSLMRPFVLKNQHIMDIAEVIYRLKTSVVPVLDLDHSYMGMVTIQDLALRVSGVISEQERGGIIVLEMGYHDYSLSEIAQIIESNDAKILSLYIKSHPDSKGLDVTVKVNQIDLSPIIQTFVRYDYNIKAVFMDDNKLKNLYNDRFDQFMNYLNI